MGDLLLIGSRNDLILEMGSLDPFESCTNDFEKNHILKAENGISSFLIFLRNVGLFAKFEFWLFLVYSCYEMTIIGRFNENWPFFHPERQGGGGLNPH